MRRIALLMLLAVAVAGFTSAACRVRGVRVAASIAPDCPYGYYEAAPYNCAPAGYYGPEWFNGGGVFLGVGPWFHGPKNFRGHVDNQFRPEHGFHGPMPARGERPDQAKRPDAAHFKGNEMRDGRGRIVKQKK